MINSKGWQSYFVFVSLKKGQKGMQLKQNKKKQRIKLNLVNLNNLFKFKR